ncbi:MAG: TolC family protein [Algoriphagus sp.]|uniref:TolC family protein n=2 Tax=Algoriphagus sp. TaxID=1872435 RepID=UPI00274AC2E4|nr:TolC family protein [Algoriphagus sp.]MDP4957545.1 TolC family protein [Algoriphagus sp.]
MKNKHITTNQFFALGSKSIRNLISPFVCLVLFLWTETQTLHAQTLEDYLLQAVENNPGLKAAYARYQATAEQVNQASLPDPELQVGAFIRPMERFMGNQTADFRLMQMFPWFGMLSTQKEEAYHMGQAEYQLFLEEKNRLFFEVKSTWNKLLLLQGEQQLAQENLDYLMKYETLALMQYQAGNSIDLPSTSFRPAKDSSSSTSPMSGMGGATPTPMQGSASSSSAMSPLPMAGSSSGLTAILQIRLQIKELESTLQQLEANKEVLRYQFQQLLNRPMEADLVLPTTWERAQLPLAKQDYLEKIKESNPMLGMFASEQMAFTQQAKMAKLEGKPMLGAGVNYMAFTSRLENGMPMGGEDMVMPMVTLSLPIYRKKISSKIKQADYLKNGAAMQQEETTNQLTLQWASAFRDWEESERLLNLYEAQVALVEQQLQVMETTFAGGNLALAEVLQTQQLLLDYRSKKLNALYQQHQSLAQLDALHSPNSINF